MDALVNAASPDFEFVPYLANLVETTTYRGHDGVRKYFEDADAAWVVVEVRLGEIREVGDHVVASGELYGKGRASGLEVRVPLVWVGAFSGGKLAWVHTYETEAAALEAVGLQE
jgi:ketosteroid isomerase-like protein